MANSLSTSAKFTCANCSEPINIDIWVIVDVSERADLVERIKAGTLYELACPQCGTKLQVDAPLLVFWTEVEPPLFFSPAATTTEDETQTQCEWLVNALCQSMGPAWRNEWIGEGVQLLPRSSLITALNNPNLVPNQHDQLSVPPGATLLQTSSEMEDAIFTIMGASQNFSLSQDLAELDAAITAWGRLSTESDLPATSQGLYPLLLNEVGKVFWQRFQIKHQLSDLERAIRLGQLAVTQTPMDSETQPRFLYNLIKSYCSLLGDPNNSISAYQEALTFIPANMPDRAGYISNLGNGLINRYNLTQELNDLEAAIGVYSEAVRCSPKNDPNRAIYSHNLGVGLRARFERLGQNADLDDAIDYLQEAVDRPQPGNSSPTHSDNLGIALRARYKRDRKRADLDAAINTWDNALKALREGDSGQAELLNGIGKGLHDRYAAYGDLADLQAAIDRLEKASAALPKGHADHAIYIADLATGLADRYSSTGNLADLEKAVYFLQNARENLPLNPRSQAFILVCLGNVLCSRSSRSKNMADIDSAISAFKEALPLIPEDDLDRAMCLNNLGGALLDRYDINHDMADLKEGIDICADAVKRDPNQAMFLNNLGNGFSERFDRLGNEVDLAGAIQAYKTAVESVSDVTPNRASYLNNLGGCLSEKFTRSNDPEDKARAIEYYRSACQQGLLNQREIAVIASRGWGRWALERKVWDEAVEATNYGLIASEVLYQGQILRDDRRNWQRDARGVVLMAAYALARANRLNEALVVLESSMARQVSETLARDSAELQAVKQMDPRLYDEYEVAVAQLRNLEGMERIDQLTTFAGVSPDWTAHRAQVEKAITSLDDIIHRIRRFAGHEDFLGQANLGSIVKAVLPNESLVYLIATPVGSLGLLIYLSVPSDGENSTAKVSLEPIWADNLTLADLDQLMVKWEGENMVGGYLPGQMDRGNWLRASLDEGLSLLSQHLVGPIAERLYNLGIENVILIPGSPFNLLPLHAARFTIAGKEKYLIDEFIVSYAPSVSILVHARRSMEGNLRKLPTLLAVGNPTPLPDEYDSLNFARAEVEEIALHFNEQAILFYEDKALLDDVILRMSSSTHLHFSCHGRFDPDMPLTSGLMLSDGQMLAMLNILSDLRLAATRLVVLSACQTAISDFKNLPEEALGLPAGFLQAGVSGVVGTLWSVNDLSTALLMIKFYEYHLGSDYGLPPASALRRAQCWLREATNENLAELFDHYRSQVGEITAMQVIAKEQYRNFVLTSPNSSQPFMHPYYWAPFAFYGA